MSLKDRLYKWFQQSPDKWFSGVSVEKMVSAKTKYGGAYTARELRHLAEEKLLEREERPWNGKKLAWYRYSPTTNAKEMERRMIEGFDSLPCCPLRCEGGERDPSVCKTLHPDNSEPYPFSKYMIKKK